MESKISFLILVIAVLAVAVCARRGGGPRGGEWEHRLNGQQIGRGRFANSQDAAWPQNPEAWTDFGGLRRNGPRQGGGQRGGRRFDGPHFEGQWFDEPRFEASGQGSAEEQNEMTGQGFRRGDGGRPFFGQGGRRDGQGPEGDTEVQPISDGAGRRYPPHSRPHPRHHRHDGPHNETTDGLGNSEEESFGRRNKSHGEGHRNCNKTSEDRPGRGPFGRRGHHFGGRSMTDNDRPGRGDMDFRPSFGSPGRFNRPFGRRNGWFDRPFRGRGRGESEEKPTMETSTGKVTTSEPGIGIEKNDEGNEVDFSVFVP